MSANRCFPVFVASVVFVIRAAGAAIAPSGAQQQVNSHTNLSQSHADVAVWLDGTAVVVWQSTTSPGDDNSESSIQAQILDSSGAPTGGQFQVNTTITGDQIRPAVAMSSEGRFLIVWQGPSDSNGLSIRGRVFEEDGTPLTTEFLVNSYEPGNQHEPDVAAVPNGGFVVTWQSFGSPGLDQTLGSIQSRRFDSAGTALATQTQVNLTATGNQLEPAIDSDWVHGGWTIAWRNYVVGGGANGNLVRTQRFDANGSPFLGEVTFRTLPETQTIEQPVVAFRPDGGFVVAWDEASAVLDPFPFEVAAQRFDFDGIPTGGLLPIPEYPDKDQRLAGIAPLSMGGFLAAWQTDDHAGNDPTRSIGAIALDQDGVQSGFEFQVNSFIDNQQEWPAVAVSPCGVGWIVWESNGSAGTDHSLGSIQAQLFVDGNPSLVFYDGFGSGNPSAWSDSVP